MKREKIITSFSFVGIIRGILTLGMCVCIYFEAGVFTALFASFTAIAIEINVAWVKEIQKHLNR